jgi:hypothetical protein
MAAPAAGDAMAAALVRAFLSGVSAGANDVEPLASAVITGSAAMRQGTVPGYASGAPAGLPDAASPALLPAGAGSTFEGGYAANIGASFGSGAHAPASSLAVGEDGSACSRLGGNPADWLISGGALGYMCAMQVSHLSHSVMRCGIFRSKTYDRI